MNKLLDSYKKAFKNDRFAQITGIQLIDASPGFAKAEMVITPNHLNAANVVQGGAIFTLADFTFAVASNTHGKTALSINAEISFFKAVDNGILTATANEISLHHKLSTYLIEIFNEKQELIAHFKGTAYRKNQEMKF